MIDVKDLRENPEKYRRGAEMKNMKVDIAAVLELDGQRVRAQQEHDKLRAEQNEASKNIAKLKDAGQKQAAIAAVGELKGKVEQAKKAAEELAVKLDATLLHVPQPADEDVPAGRDDTENVEIRKWSEPRRFEFAPKDHVTLGMELGLIDIERGVKLAG